MSLDLSVSRVFYNCTRRRRRRRRGGGGEGGGGGGGGGGVGGGGRAEEEEGGGGDEQNCLSSSLYAKYHVHPYGSYILSIFLFPQLGIVSQMRMFHLAGAKV